MAHPITPVSRLVIACLAAGSAFPAAPAGKPDRERLKKAFEAGNFKEAYEGYRPWRSTRRTSPKLVGDDLGTAVECLRKLGRVEEVDDFREAVIKAHADNFRLAQAAAESLLAVENFGFIVAGKFQRGNKRGGGEFVALERPRPGPRLASPRPRPGQGPRRAATSRRRAASTSRSPTR